MTATLSTRFLHIANGTCTTDIIEAAGLPGALSTWGEPLHEGPVPEGLSDDELLEVRAGHLGGGDEAAIAQAREWLQASRTALDDGASYDEVVLWFEHDLFDQLNLVQLLDRLASAPAAAAHATLICIGSFPGRSRFKGLGELTASELASLFETRQPVSEAQLTLASRAWRALRAADPRAIEALLGTDTSALPFLAAAFERHLEELPWTRDGLSRSERQLLELAAATPIDLHDAFPRMHDTEQAYYITDLSLADLVDDLAHTSPALVITALAASSGHALPRGTVASTDAGRAILTGELDRVRQCGVDRWLGGVHLHGTGETWRWDDTHRCIVRA